MARFKLCKLVHFKNSRSRQGNVFSRCYFHNRFYIPRACFWTIFYFDLNIISFEVANVKNTMFAIPWIEWFLPYFRWPYHRGYTNMLLIIKNNFFQQAAFLIYHVKIFCLARENGARLVEMCWMHFGTIRHFSMYFMFVPFAGVSTVHGSF